MILINADVILISADAILINADAISMGDSAILNLSVLRIKAAINKTGGLHPPVSHNYLV